MLVLGSQGQVNGNRAWMYRLDAVPTTYDRMWRTSNCLVRQCAADHMSHCKTSRVTIRGRRR